MSECKLEVDLIEEKSLVVNELDYKISGLNDRIDLISSHADKYDYLISISSGVLCGIVDVLWVKEFDLLSGRKITSKEVAKIVKKTANLLGCKDDSLKGCVKFLEEMFHNPSDGNTPEFGGGLQHHLRDFSHHPTIVGLIFSLLTQFTEISYGTDTDGRFLMVQVKDKDKKLIGKDIPTKIFNGTIIWFFHLISDVSGSSNTANKGGGTGIPGPILSLAKELSALPMFNNIKFRDEELSTFLSKIFNGTIFSKRDDEGKIIKESIIKMDFRGELGVFLELGKMAIPVIANDVIVRSFYFIRRLYLEFKDINCKDFSKLIYINWDNVKPFDNATISRMLTISSSVFSTIDVSDAIISEKYFVAVNYIGLGRFFVALGNETLNLLKIRDIQEIKRVYEIIKRNTFTKNDNNIYQKIGENVELEKFSLTIEETEILYNIEYYKTQNDIRNTYINKVGPNIKSLKIEWLYEWKEYMSQGFSSFMNDDTAVLHWYKKSDLLKKINENNPKGTWFRLVLLESMLFEPYFALDVELDKKGKEIPSKKYSRLNNKINGYKISVGDDFLETFFDESYYKKGYISRLRKCHNKMILELNEVIKSFIKGAAITVGVLIISLFTAGTFAPAIATALVGSEFTGLSGAALTSACLAYLGGGAVASGGLGMAGGTMVIVGGGAALGLSVGTLAGGSVIAHDLINRENTIIQSAKLMVSVREIFLNDEKDLVLSDTIFENYVNKISIIEKYKVDLELKSITAPKEEKKELKKKISEMDDTVNAMKIAMKSMNKFNSSFKEGLRKK